jgi:FkbM family methyltransferase
MKKFFFKTLEKMKSLFSKLGFNRRTFALDRIYTFFYKIFWPYEKLIEIQGIKMVINPREVSLEMLKTFEIYKENKIHEKETTELLKKIVKEGNLFVDLGANMGYFTLLAAKLVGPQGKVFSFEPEPKNYRCLLKNIEINNYKNVIALQKAVSDRKGKTRLYICDYDSGHHTINKFDGIESYSRGRFTRKHSIEIETITLDDFFKNQEDSIDIIKMDIEGAEALALTGMDNILRKNKKLKMIVEFFPLLIRKMGNSPEEFIRKLLEDYQFSINIIPGDYDAQKGEMIKIKEVSKIFDFCRGEMDHLNLFLEHNSNDKVDFKKN